MKQLSSILGVFLSVAGIFFIVGLAKSQSLTDAVRVGSEPLGNGARASAMGGAAIANANDFSALYWNPAALTLMDFGEVSLSLFFKGHNSSANFLGITTDQSVTNTALQSFGYASPVDTRRGHLAFGISYDRVLDYYSAYSFKAINPTSSFLDSRNFVNSQGNRTSLSPTDFLNSLYDNNLAWSLFLTHNADSAHPNLTTPFRGALEQSGTITQEGGMNAIRLGGGIDVAENIALGATLNIFLGSYDYRRVYKESDVNNVFSKPQDTIPPDNFSSAQIIDTRKQSQSGFSLKLGFLATPGEHLKIGFTFETPAVYSIEDQFQRTGSSLFKNGSSYNSTDRITNNNVGSLNPIIINNYVVTTPMKFGGGLSYNTAGLTLSGAATYSDPSQLRYSDADVDLSDLNDSARQNLSGVLNWKIGAEYIFSPIGVILRGGYSSNPSPYKSDPKGYGTKSITGGLGFLLSKSAIAELTYRRSSYRTDHTIYNDLTMSGTAVSAVVNTDDVVQNQVILSFSLRF